MNDSMRENSSDVLMVRARTWVCTLPASSVIEVMRALPIEPVVGAPAYILGMAIVRGEITPVLALGQLLGSNEEIKPRRFVLVRANDRRAVLGVDEVIGMSTVDMRHLQEAPGLLSEALPHDVARLGVLDRSVLVLLEAGKLLSEDIWRAITASGTTEQ